MSLTTYLCSFLLLVFFFSSRRRHTISDRDWSSDVCSSDLCLLRIMAGGMTAKKHLGFEFAAWYWHFVDVVWLFLFAFVYVAPHLIFGGGGH